MCHSYLDLTVKGIENTCTKSTCNPEQLSKNTRSNTISNLVYTVFRNTNKTIMTIIKIIIYCYFYHFRDIPVKVFSYKWLPPHLPVTLA